jgi:hypothetical protein
MQVIYAIFVGLYCCVTSFEIHDANKDGVIFGNFTPEGQQIIVNENNAGGTSAIAVIIEVEGTLVVDQLGTNNLLEPLLDQKDNTTYSLSVNLLDFEKLRQEQIGAAFLLDILEVESQSRTRLQIIVNNIDDESPELQTASCVMEEKTVIDVNNSECVFTVSDPDGWLNLMDFTEFSDSILNNLFAFKYKTEPEEDVQRSDIYLVLQDGQKLDYETRSLYAFNIKPKDGAGHTVTPLSSIPVIVQVKDVPDQPLEPF